MNKHLERGSESGQVHLSNGEMIPAERPRTLFTPDATSQVAPDRHKQSGERGLSYQLGNAKSESTAKRQTLVAM